MQNKKSFWEILKSLINIVLLAAFAYGAMVFISHFAEYSEAENYKYIDSFFAIFGGSNIANEFILYFWLSIAALIVLGVLIKKTFDLIKTSK